jgi:integrase
MKEGSMASIVKGKNKDKPYTVRYRFEGRQREESFAQRRQALDFKAKVEHDIRAAIFVDQKVTNERFAVVAKRWLDKHPGADRTITGYDNVLRLHILPVFGNRPLIQVAGDRDGVERFLRETMPGKGLGTSMVRTASLVINSIVNDAVKAGRLTPAQHRLKGISLPPVQNKAELPHASHEQIVELAQALPGPYRPSVYLMRGCGLRLGEVLGVRGEDITDGTLRLRRQLAPNGRGFAPLKHRKEGDYRDVPIPQYVLSQLDEGWPGFPMKSHRSYQYFFVYAKGKAGLPEDFTPHSLRHIFASVCLASGIPITDVSKWLGHRNIQTTFGIYGHLVPASWDRARGALDAEWEH